MATLTKDQIKTGRTYLVRFRKEPTAVEAVDYTIFDHWSKGKNRPQGIWKCKRLSDGAFFWARPGQFLEACDADGRPVGGQ